MTRSPRLDPRACRLSDEASRRLEHLVATMGLERAALAVGSTKITLERVRHGGTVKQALRDRLEVAILGAMS